MQGAGPVQLPSQGPPDTLGAAPRLPRQMNCPDRPGSWLWPHIPTLSSPLKSPPAASGLAPAQRRPHGSLLSFCTKHHSRSPASSSSAQIASLNVLSPETRASSHKTMKMGPPPPPTCPGAALAWAQWQTRKEVPVGLGTNHLPTPRSPLHRSPSQACLRPGSTNHQSWQLGPNTLPLAPCYNQRPIQSLAF